MKVDNVILTRLWNCAKLPFILHTFNHFSHERYRFVDMRRKNIWKISISISFRKKKSISKLNSVLLHLAMPRRELHGIIFWWHDEKSIFLLLYFDFIRIHFYFLIVKAKCWNEFALLPTKNLIFWWVAGWLQFIDRNN